MKEVILQLEHIVKSFGENEVLQGIDLEIYSGEFITLLGSSGCGKTTTLRIISGLEMPDGGRVFVEGRDVTWEEPNKRDVNTVFQNYALFPHMTVEENIGYSLRLKRVKKPEIRREVEKVLTLVQLEGYEKRMPNELSGGQRQRVAIARAIINRPRILLLDEPLGALDLQLRRQMQGELKRLQKQLGITFIYITHDQEEALNMSDRIVVMRAGLFEQIGTPDEIYSTPKTSFVAGFVGSANILSGPAERVEEDFVVIRHPQGRFLVKRRGADVKAGQLLRAAVRGEEVGIRKITSEQPDAPGLTGKVLEKNLSGGMLRILVSLCDGEEMVVSRCGIRADVEIGDSVFLEWSGEHAALIDLEESI